MRAYPALLAIMAAVAGCAAPTAPDNAAAASRDGQMRACATAVAEHVGLTPDAVTATWRETTAADTAIVAVRDGDRLHTCEVDSGLRVLRILHPGR
jgi:hypothetical protein